MKQTKGNNMKKLIALTALCFALTACPGKKDPAPSPAPVPTASPTPVTVTTTLPAATPTPAPTAVPVACDANPTIKCQTAIGGCSMFASVDTLKAACLAHPGWSAVVLGTQVVCPGGGPALGCALIKAK